MKKLLLILLPLAIVCLGGCTNYNEALGNHQSILNELMEDVRSNTQRIEKLEIDIIDKHINQGTEKKDKLCVGIDNITVATYQAKDLFECIGNGEGYCTCIEKFASCGDLILSEIPQEARNTFKPDCYYQ